MQGESVREEGEGRRGRRAAPLSSPPWRVGTSRSAPFTPAS